MLSNSLTNRYQNKRRSKRLQKKLHLNDFKELGFDIKFSFGSDITEEQSEDIVYDFVENFIEPNNLMFAGFFRAFICKEKGSCTEEDKQKVLDYFADKSKSITIEMSPLIDAWYGPFED